MGFVTQRIFDRFVFFVAAVERRRVVHGAPAQTAVILMNGSNGETKRSMQSGCSKPCPLAFQPSNGTMHRDNMPDNVILLTRRVHAVFKHTTDVGSHSATPSSLGAKTPMRIEV